MAARLSATIIFNGDPIIRCELYPSSENSQKVRFNLLSPDGHRVKQQYVDAKSGEPVARSDMVKGYQFAKDQYVPFTADELKALEAEATKAIEIVEFVPIDQVERAYINKTYYLGPEDIKDPKKGSPFLHALNAKQYRLLGIAMTRSNRCALAKYSARGKQYLVLVRPVGDHLVMEQLHYANEVRDIGQVPAGEGEVTEADIDAWVNKIEQHTADEFDPSKYQDDVGRRMLEAIEAKIADGLEITAPAEEESKTQVIDLMAALRARVEKSEGSGPKKAKKPASALSQKRRKAAGS